MFVSVYGVLIRRFFCFLYSGDLRSVGLDICVYVCVTVCKQKQTKPFVAGGEQFDTYPITAVQNVNDMDVSCDFFFPFFCREETTFFSIAKQPTINPTILKMLSALGNVNVEGVRFGWTRTRSK